VKGFFAVGDEKGKQKAGGVKILQGREKGKK